MGYSMSYGDIWQFWPYEAKLQFKQKYGIHPSGFKSDYTSEIQWVMPTENDLQLSEASDMIESIFLETGRKISVDSFLIDAFLTNAYVCIGLNQQGHSWIINLYSHDEKKYIQEYTVMVCSEHHRVEWIVDTHNAYIDHLSSEHPIDYVMPEYIYVATASDK